MDMIYLELPKSLFSFYELPPITSLKTDLSLSDAHSSMLEESFLT